ncbi:hypothetical protein C1645_777148 [Glomus cerebriforme]|uniref:Mid2 domain-containing protein n=1 Tax=Glomus cerebriforme TaxID=658196 RepID=A0A397SRL9_9GLOM|nr:hypothetical protein C1645_777148 [Glomus cerebriforme]
MKKFILYFAIFVILLQFILEVNTQTYPVIEKRNRKTTTTAGSLPSSPTGSIPPQGPTPPDSSPTGSTPPQGPPPDSSPTGSTPPQGPPPDSTPIPPQGPTPPDSSPISPQGPTSPDSQTGSPKGGTSSQIQPPDNHTNKTNKTGSIVGGVLGSFAFISLCIFLVRSYRSKYGKYPGITDIENNNLPNQDREVTPNNITNPGITNNDLDLVNTNRGQEFIPNYQ